MNVARLANIPLHVIQRAQEIAKQVQLTETKNSDRRRLIDIFKKK